ncbi:MAG: hydrolase 2, exosortase A system-associated [Ramlibacter sp.]|nr:hydrolase 2, exosortase A system-associated [Ramlibacter sp.]
MATPFEAFFLPAGAGRSGQRFCLFHPPREAGQQALGALLHVHAFAEEMNKSRRMAALQSRALASAGYAVLQIDLLGCGDSSGDFGDATWSGWLLDVQQAAAWLRNRCDAPLWLWGHRAGALLAAQAAPAIEARCNFLMWQPATAGSVVLQQFLRLKVAGEMRNGGAKGAMESLKKRIADGESIEVAGYRVSSDLATGLGGSVLTAPARAGATRWLDMSQTPGATLSPAASAAIDRWRAAGVEVHGQVIQGPAFWQTSEIEEAPDLIDATVSALNLREVVAA